MVTMKTLRKWRMNRRLARLFKAVRLDVAMHRLAEVNAFLAGVACD